jgi:pimeloyl-ACP methyl ester carboxylesterase
MSGFSSAAHTLDVPGARLYYERRGTGRLLLMIGSPMDSAGFAWLAGALAGEYTVVTYDPRGLGDSSRDDTGDVTPEQQASDVHHLVSALGGGPADVFGSSGGGVVGLALVTAYPAQVRTLVAHEPPAVELLPDSAQVQAQIQDIYDTYRPTGRTRRCNSSWPTPASCRPLASRQTHRSGNLHHGRWPGCAPAPIISSTICSGPPRDTGPTSPRCARHRPASWPPPGPCRRGNSLTERP